MKPKRPIANTARLARLVLRRRAALGLSTRDVAASAGLDVAFVSFIEHERYALPNPLSLRALARALDLPPIELLLAVGYVLPADLNAPVTRPKK